MRFDPKRLLESGPVMAVRPYLLQIVILIAAFVIIGAQTPIFRGMAALSITLDGYALLGLVALGMGITILVGELDLSVASMAAFAGVLAVRVGDFGLLPALLLVPIATALIGFLQGCLIARLRIHSLVVTVATLTMLSGAAFVVSGEAPIAMTKPQLTDPLFGLIGGVITPASVIALVVMVGIGIFLAFFKSGREMYAIGGARAEAFASGVPTTRPIAIAFALSGYCAGLGGALTALQAASATPDAFHELLVLAVSAVLIGGLSIHGGRGTVVHVILGVAIVNALLGGLSIVGIPEYISQFYIGLLLFIVVIAEIVSDRVHGVRRRRSLAGSRSLG